LKSKLDLLQKKAESVRSIDSEVDQAMQLVDRLTELAEQSEEFKIAKRDLCSYNLNQKNLQNELSIN
tara:strand:- start:60 stop:260 length:201 start_codon:yes stop_codon:yes gene_type:complete